MKVIVKEANGESGFPSWRVFSQDGRNLFIAHCPSDADADFIARCIRLANPPERATRQVWKVWGRGWAARGTDGFYATRDQAMREWHHANGGKREAASQ